MEERVFGIRLLQPSSGKHCDGGAAVEATVADAAVKFSPSGQAASEPPNRLNITHIQSGSHGGTRANTHTSHSLSQATSSTATSPAQVPPRRPQPHRVTAGGRHRSATIPFVRLPQTLIPTCGVRSGNVALASTCTRSRQPTSVPFTQPGPPPADCYLVRRKGSLSPLFPAHC